jgi:hypothetical protein
MEPVKTTLGVPPLEGDALDRIFVEARTYSDWLDAPSETGNIK